MQRIIKKFFCPLSPEHEAGYTLTCAERILHYNGFFLFAIIAIQIYNLLYALVYTRGRLNTLPSRVYSFLYLLLLLVSVAAVLCKNHFKKNVSLTARNTVRLQTSYGIFLLLWGSCITLYDQRVSSNISVYIIISLSVAFLIYFKPLTAVSVYISLLIFLLFLQPVFQQQPTDNYGIRLSLAIVTLMSILISCYRYTANRKLYLNQQIILEQNLRLSNLANIDSLTGLRNRRFFEKDMEDLYQSCVKSQTSMTMMMMDIDFFKAYNDRYGHQQGDECLRRMAWCLNQVLDPSCEYLIRYGGEEFLYITTGLDAAAAAQKAQQFNEIIRKLIIGPSDQDYRSITISIGLCTRIPSGTSDKCEWLEFISEADRALYAAKSNGRDQWVAV